MATVNSIKSTKRSGSVGEAELAARDLVATLEKLSRRITKLERAVDAIEATLADLHPDYA